MLVSDGDGFLISTRVFIPSEETTKEATCFFLKGCASCFTTIALFFLQTQTSRKKRAIGLFFQKLFLFLFSSTNQRKNVFHPFFTTYNKKKKRQTAHKR